jgi:membrane-associated phospholipid phosphatase
VAQGRSLLAAFAALAGRRLGWAFASMAGAAGVAFVMFPHDPRLLAQFHFLPRGAEHIAQGIASFFGTWGDYLTCNVPVALAIWGYGVWKRDRAWRRIGVVCFLGATLAGIFDDCFRLTLGRPRPDAHVHDGFYGVAAAFRGHYQSFPSGHAASMFGMAVALVQVCRPLGWIALAYAGAVAWARVELYRHYPSDVIVGAMVGIYFGTVLGAAARARFKM